MIFQKKKGQFGYLKKAPVIQGLFTLVLMLLPVGLFLIGFFTTHGYKNLFTVVAVVGMLPVAKGIVTLIMYFRAEKFSCPEELHDKIKKYEGKKAFIGYDYYLTSYSVNYPIPAAAVGKQSLIGLCRDPKTDLNAAESHIKEYLKKNEISGITVKIFDSEEKFLGRIASLADSEDEPTENEQKAFALLASLSL